MSSMLLYLLEDVVDTIYELFKMYWRSTKNTNSQQKVKLSNSNFFACYSVYNMRWHNKQTSEKFPVTLFFNSHSRIPITVKPLHDEFHEQFHSTIITAQISLIANNARLHIPAEVTKLPTTYHKTLHSRIDEKKLPKIPHIIPSQLNPTPIIAISAIHVSV